MVIVTTYLNIINLTAMEIQPSTDREVMIRLDSKMDNLAGALERFAATLENLEVHKISEIETRLDAHDKILNQWSGIWKFVVGISIVLSIISVLLQVKHG